MEIFKSKKFWVSLGGIATVILSSALDLPSEKAELLVNSLVTIIIGYLVAQGSIDVTKEVMKPKDTGTAWVSVQPEPFKYTVETETNTPIVQPPQATETPPPPPVA